MKTLKIKLICKIWDTKFKAERTYKFSDTADIGSTIEHNFCNLLYLKDKISFLKYELYFKVNNGSWMYYNSHDYCLYLKNEYFKNNENIDGYTLLERLEDLGYERFMIYLGGLRENEH